MLALCRKGAPPLLPTIYVSCFRGTRFHGCLVDKKIGIAGGCFRLHISGSQRRENATKRAKMKERIGLEEIH